MTQPPRQQAPRSRKIHAERLIAEILLTVVAAGVAFTLARKTGLSHDVAMFAAGVAASQAFGLLIRHLLDRPLVPYGLRIVNRRRHTPQPATRRSQPSRTSSANRPRKKRP